MINRLRFSYSLRKILSFAPYLGAYKVPARPDGISATLRVYNERDWLERSIESVAPFVDEIIAVDTGSTDGSKEILERLAAKLPNMKLYALSSRLPWEYTNFILQKTTYRWVLKWDADFVALDGDNGMRRVREWLKTLDPHRHYHFNLTLVELAGDFKHQFPSCRTRHDTEIFTYSPHLKFVPVVRELPADPDILHLPARFLERTHRVRFEGPFIPLFYVKGIVDWPFAFHVNIKPAMRLLYGFYYLQWLLKENLKAFPSLEDFMRHKTGALGCGSLDEAARLYVDEYVKNLAPYDKTLADFPAALKDCAARSPYTVIYENDRIIGRNDGLIVRKVP